VAPATEKPVAPVSIDKTEFPKAPAARTKTTTNLLDALQGKSREAKQEEKVTQTPKTEAPVQLSDLKKAWTAFAEQSKGNISHYHLLNRDFEFNGTLITLPLTNPIEEPLLDTLKLQLITFLRDKLGNSTISVTGTLQEMNTRKVAYTTKEKFDQLAQKNPMLVELKNRLGLDTEV
jgi:DNA polymerase-3 subunit gamma/tau